MMCGEHLFGFHEVLFLVSVILYNYVIAIRVRGMDFRCVAPCLCVRYRRMNKLVVLRAGSVVPFVAFGF